MSKPEESAAPPANLDVGDGRNPITVPLSDPVKHGGVLLEELVLQPLKGKHLKKLPVDTANMNIGHVMGIAAIQATVPDSVIEELGPADLANVLGVTNGFLSLVQGTGGSS